MENLTNNTTKGNAMMTEQEFKALCTANNKLVEVIDALNNYTSNKVHKTIHDTACKLKHRIFNEWSKEVDRRKKARAKS